MSLQISVSIMTVMKVTGTITWRICGPQTLDPAIGVPVLVILCAILEMCGRLRLLYWNAALSVFIGQLPYCLGGFSSRQSGKT